MKKIIIASFLFPFIFNLAQSNYINLDEDLTDWDEIPTICIDEQFSGHSDDFRELKVTNDQNYIYFLLSFYNDVLLQDFNDITIYIDVDNNPLTGLSFEKVGAELEFTFGERRGKIHSQFGTSSITHFDIGLVSSPSVTSEVFEIAISSAEFNSFPTTIDTIKILFSGGDGVADLMPNDGSGCEYVLQNITAEMVEINLAKEDDDDLRILCYNVHRDDIFNSSEQPAFERQLKAINPDIIGFQEIYDHSSQDVAELMDQWLPVTNGQWYHSRTNPDIIVVSKYPVLTSTNIGSNGAFLIDMNEQFQRELLIVNAHTPCCANNVARQDEMDEFMAFVRDSKNQVNNIPIDEYTPIIVLGDMNMVGYSEQQRTILEGDIKDNAKYGEDFSPDWDGTSFDDSKPWTTGRPMAFTWYSEGETFSPGRLDYLIYTGSVMKQKNSFVLFTKGMSQTQLSDLGLQADDNVNSSDHLPVVADFELTEITSVGELVKFPSDYSLAQNYPNPFNPWTTIAYTIPVVDVTTGIDGPHVALHIYDTLGQEVATLVNQKQLSGDYTVTWKASKQHPSGIYFYKISFDEKELTRKMILIK